MTCRAKAVKASTRRRAHASVSRAFCPLSSRLAPPACRSPNKGGVVIGLIRVLAPESAPEATEVLAELPPQPAWRFVGFLVHCRRTREVEKTLAWLDGLQPLRPHTPVGMIARPKHSAHLLAPFPHPIPVFLNPEELLAGEVPRSVLVLLRRSSLQGRLFDNVVSNHPEVRNEGEILLALISRAAHGGTLNGAARDLGCTPQTVRRRLKRCAISPGRLMRRVRLKAFELRISLGMDRAAALQAGGWSSHHQRRKTAARLRPID